MTNPFKKLFGRIDNKLDQVAIGAIQEAVRLAHIAAARHAAESAVHTLQRLDPEGFDEWLADLISDLKEKP